LLDRIWPNMRDAFFECFVDGLRQVDSTIPDPRLASSRPISHPVGSHPERRSD
jgi:hypothetical protein